MLQRLSSTMVRRVFSLQRQQQTRACTSKLNRDLSEGKLDRAAVVDEFCGYSGALCAGQEIVTKAKRLPIIESVTKLKKALAEHSSTMDPFQKKQMEELLRGLEKQQLKLNEQVLAFEKLLPPDEEEELEEVSKAEASEREESVKKELEGEESEGEESEGVESEEESEREKSD